MVKGHLTGCGLHGYTPVSFHILTCQSNIVGSCTYNSSVNVEGPLGIVLCQ